MSFIFPLGPMGRTGMAVMTDRILLIALLLFASLVAALQFLDAVQARKIYNAIERMRLNQLTKGAA